MTKNVQFSKTKSENHPSHRPKTNKNISYRFALDGVSEELGGGHEDGGDDEEGHGPLVVELEREVVDGDFADAEEDFGRGLGDTDGRGHVLVVASFWVQGDVTACNCDVAPFPNFAGSLFFFFSS